MPQKPQAHVHKMIAEVAQAAAHELYDSLMMDDLLYECWKKQHPGMGPKALEAQFVARKWPLCIEFARATLAHMLTTPIDNSQKDAIMEALALDSGLVRGRCRGADLMGQGLLLQHQARDEINKPRTN